MPPPTLSLMLFTLAALPLGWSLWAAVQAGLDAAGWWALWLDPQTLRALAMSLWTGLLASALSTATAAWMLCRTFSALSGAAAGDRLARGLAPLLALSGMEPPEFTVMAPFAATEAMAELAVVRQLVGEAKTMAPVVSRPHRMAL